MAADILKPREAREVERAVQLVLAEGKALELIGQGSKRAIGRPTQTALTLDLSALAGVTLYEPEELVLSAKAGTPLAEIEVLLDANRQQLAFEPMDYASILGGGGARRGTIGGALAANLAGPRRIKVGAARDHFLGFSAVSGRGETFKSGGRVVKNVTGYDLCKLLAGSWGTLAAMTEVTLKVLPKPETEATVIIRGLEPARAVEAMTAAMGSSCDVSGAAHLPTAAAACVPDIAGAGSAVTALRVEGFAPSVAHRVRLLEAVARPFGELATLSEPASRRLWLAVRDVAPFAAGQPTGDWVLWRLSVAPSHGAEVDALIGNHGEAHLLYDWAGGLIWMALRASEDGGAKVVRRAVAATGGHATLIRAPAALRAAIDVFEPQPAAVAALTKRIKASFDPNGVLNPGRMWAGV
jgi:glycolate oxidase FAD binding subunit